MSLITLASLNHGIDPQLMLSICYHETGFKDSYKPQDGTSPSYGVCQVKELTAVQVGLPRSSVKTPEGSVEVAVKYMKYNLKRCKNTKDAIGAYNTGHCGKGSKYSNAVLNDYTRF